MTLFGISIGISVAVVGLVVYSALVVSSRQEQIAQRIREENRFKRAPYAPYSANIFAFETAKELVSEDESDETSDSKENQL